MGKHQKHTKLARPSLGQWGRNEWAVMGTTCSNIKLFAEKIAEALEGKCKVAYIDASHAVNEENTTPIYYSLTSESDHCLIHSSESMTDYNAKILLQYADVLLINGNHYSANRQIVFNDPIKEESLKRKKHLLTAIDSIIYINNNCTVNDFLSTHINAQTKYFEESEINRIAHHLYEQSLNKLPIMGLVLSGGKSSRMGQDKSQLSYHGLPQKEYLAALLNKHCHEVFMSENTVSQDLYRTIKDTFFELGPMGGILSAFRFDPNSAWLTVAVDLPFVDDKTIEMLIGERNPSKVATCFIKSDAEFPDPLCTIWEPKAYPRILNFLSLGYSCPRKVLINSDVHVVKIPNDDVLYNVNSPSDLQEVMGIISKK